MPAVDVIARQPPTEIQQLDAAIRALERGKERLSRISLDERIALAKECLAGVFDSAREWVAQACDAKGIPEGSPSRAEEIAAGPAAAARYLVLVIQTLEAIARDGRPNLAKRISPGPGGRVRIRALPEPALYDSIALAGLEAHIWIDRSKSGAFAGGQHPGWRFPSPAVGLVLGAGNVSSIAVTDAFSKIFQENRAVLLKMNPVNDYLGPIFERAFAGLIGADLLRIVYGGADVGAAALADERIGEVHITGSVDSHDAIVWGRTAEERAQRRAADDPRLKKPITSELGNVTPWIIVPGRYSRRQLVFQAENVAASITNNASFNCVATKVIVTWKGWPQREEFLRLLDAVLARVPPRRAYYPGAKERFCRFAPTPPPGDGETLPWTLLRGADPADSPHLLREESFVCVCAETPLAAQTEEEFLERAVQFANEQLWGTLAATLTVPDSYRTQAGRTILNAHVEALRYGSVAINHWPALLFAMMTAPWGGYPGTDLRDVQSGTGWVHNTLFLEGVEKTVLEGPLVVSPKPMWFPTHPNPEPIAWRLLDLYRNPTPWNLARLVGRAVAGSLGW